MERLRGGISEGDRAEQERLDVVRALRNQAVSLLKKYGERRPNYRLYIGIPILPIAVLAAFISWPIRGVNPLDFITKKVWRGQVDAVGVTAVSSEGDPSRADLIVIEMSGLSRLELPKSGGDTLYPFNPGYDPDSGRDGRWIGGKWTGGRNASTGELSACQRVLLAGEESLALGRRLGLAP